MCVRVVMCCVALRCVVLCCVRARWASYWAFASHAIVKPDPPAYLWVDHVSQYERNVGGKEGSSAGWGLLPKA